MPGSTSVLNAANEVAVEAFLQRQIRFDQIHQLNRLTLDGMNFQSPQNLAELLALDVQARAFASEGIGRLRSS